MRLIVLLLLMSVLSCTNDLSSQKKRLPDPSLTKEQLGEQFFNDISLSKNGTQSCASCHMASNAFIDPRVNDTSADNQTAGAVSLGQDNKSLGDINTPTITYAMLSPKFFFGLDMSGEEELFQGGLFVNGRAKDLIEQAKEPFLNPLEMQSTIQHVVAQVEKKYSSPMKALFGQGIFDDEEKAFTAIATAIASFEKTKQFASFDSKFDRVLAGKEMFSAQEQWGKELFEAEDKGNCAACHIVPTNKSTPAESIFTDFTYDNLGVPANNRVRHLNGKGENFKDLGLYNNPNVKDESLKGAFKVNTLRNIAVTAPYMHNGVFNDLKTVVAFYNSRDVKGALNPETGEPWRKPEVPETMNTEELGDLGLSNAEMDAIVAFMKTLTDARYEALMN